MNKNKKDILDSLLNQSTVQVNVRLPVRLRARMEEFLQYMERPPAERVPDSVPKWDKEAEAQIGGWPTSNQALVQAAIEEYLAHRPLKTRTGSDLKRNPDHPKRKKPKPKIKPRSTSQEARTKNRHPSNPNNPK